MLRINGAPVLNGANCHSGYTHKFLFLFFEVPRPPFWLDLILGSSVAFNLILQLPLAEA